MKHGAEYKLGDEGDDEEIVDAPHDKFNFLIRVIYFLLDTNECTVQNDEETEKSVHWCRHCSGEEESLDLVLVHLKVSHIIFSNKFGRRSVVSQCVLVHLHFVEISLAYPIVFVKFMHVNLS